MSIRRRLPKRFTPFALPLLLAACRSTEPPAASPAPVAPASSESARVAVLPLAHAVAQQVTQVVQASFARRGGCTLMVVPDPRTNSLIVSGSPSEVEEVRELVAKLDVEVESAR